MFIQTIRNFLLFFSRKKTIGVRILLTKNDKALLVKHTYLPGWYTIGGGVDAGESPLQALHRELQEETGVTLKAAPQLFSVYYRKSKLIDDYVIFYIANDFEEKNHFSLEILEKKWYALSALPVDVSPATKRRVDEYLGVKPIDENW